MSTLLSVYTKPTCKHAYIQSTGRSAGTLQAVQSQSDEAERRRERRCTSEGLQVKHGIRLFPPCRRGCGGAYLSFGSAAHASGSQGRSSLPLHIDLYVWAQDGGLPLPMKAHSRVLMPARLWSPHTFQPHHSSRAPNAAITQTDHPGNSNNAPPPLPPLHPTPRPVPFFKDIPPPLPPHCIQRLPPQFLSLLALPPHHPPTRARGYRAWARLPELPGARSDIAGANDGRADGVYGSFVIWLWGCGRGVD